MRSTYHDNHKQQQLTEAPPPKIVRKRFWRFAVIGVFAAGIATVAFGLTPANVVPAGGTTITVDNSLGNQTDPHVNGDLAVYTNGGAQIRYYDFVTLANNAVPGATGAQDTLSDVLGNTISFSRTNPDFTTNAMVFDVSTNSTTLIHSEAGALQFNPVLGGNQVAYVDLNSGNGDIRVFDLTTHALANVSASLDPDDSPSLSPSGNAVVWERCVGANCDIYRSVQTGGVWGAAEVIVNSLSNEENPDTDGTTVVYDSNRGGDSDIYFQPLMGGPEVQLQLAGDQVNPSISNGIIAFESRNSGSGDIYVYVIATNTLVQVTNTPLVDDTLNDVTVLPDGQIRVVWSSLEADSNVYSRTFSVPTAVVYNFNGFFQPVDNLPTLNIASAGSSIPVKFSLGGNQGLAIFAAGYPASSPIPCDMSDPGVVIEETATAGGSGLSYDATTDQYGYVWKTDKAWKGTCRMLVVKFNDGSQQLARFRFR